jgi:predicted Zn-dependent peptidase
MLPHGAGSRSALDIADAIDFLGADLTTGSGADASAVRLHVPVQRLDEALAVMADVALRPTFPSDELERLRKQRLTDLIQARDDPETIAQLAFSRVVFGPSHRFGTAFMGTAATIKAFTTADLRAFYQSTYRPDNAVLMVVGDVTPAKTLPLLESKFGSWKRVDSPKTRVVHSPASPPTKRDVYLIDKPGAPQSQIRIGAIGVSRTNPDYFAIQVMNTVLGGSFSSRLNLNLREKQGFAYNASSAFDMRREPGPVFAYAGVQTDKTADALREFFNELEAIGKPVGPYELTKGKNYLALGFPSEFESIADLSAHVEELVVYTLADDYFERYISRVQAVTAADVGRAAGTFIQPQRFAVVVAGDRAAIEASIRALGLGAVRVMSVSEATGL